MITPGCVVTQQDEDGTERAGVVVDCPPFRAPHHAIAVRFEPLLSGQVTECDPASLTVAPIALTRIGSIDL